MMFCIPQNAAALHGIIRIKALMMQRKEETRRSFARVVQCKVIVIGATRQPVAKFRCNSACHIALQGGCGFPIFADVTWREFDDAVCPKGQGKIAAPVNVGCKRAA